MVLPDLRSAASTRFAYRALDPLIALCLLQIALGANAMLFSHLAYLSVAVGAWLRRSGRAAMVRAVLVTAGIGAAALLGHRVGADELLELPLMLAIALAAAVQARLREEDEQTLLAANVELQEAN